MSDRRQYLITFHSQKGGVGKTVLAWHLANALAEPRRLRKRANEPALKVALIDADLTGTSLSDVVAVRAVRPNGTSTDYMDVDAARHVMKHKYEGCLPESKTPPLAFLNRLLLCDPVEYQGIWAHDADDGSHRSGTQAVRLVHYLWQADSSSNLSVLPSSAYPEDVRMLAPHLFREDITDHFCHRFADLVLALLGRSIADGSKQKQHPDVYRDGYDAVIIDCPPTLRGISAALLRCHTKVAERLKNGGKQDSVSRSAAFVMGEDRQDVAALSRSLDEMMQDKELETAGHRAVLVLNRYSTFDTHGNKRRVPLADAEGNGVDAQQEGEEPKYDMTDPDSVRALYHKMLREYLADPHEQLTKAPGQPGALFNSAVCVPYDEPLGSTFKTDSVGKLPDWGHPEALLRLVEEVLR